MSDTTQPTQPAPAAPSSTSAGQNPSNGLAIAALVTGIAAFIFGWAPFFGVLLGIAAVILGIMAIKRNMNKGMSIAGIITGAIGGLWSLIITLLFIVGLAAIGTSAPALQEALQEAEQSIEQAANEEATDPGTPTTDGPVDPVTLTGTGQTATDQFALQSGLTTFKMTHQGSGHFSVTLMNDEGEYIDLLANDIGAFDGSKASRIDMAGNYLLDISADGPWTVTITQ